MKFERIRSILIKLFLATLIVAAAIAVITILIGEMNDIAGRAIGTVIAAMIHIAILFAILSVVFRTERDRRARSTNLVVNALVVIVTLSLFTSIFGTWQLLDGEIVSKLYVTYLIFIVAILHSKMLDDIYVMNARSKYYIFANYFFIILVALLLLGVVYTPDGVDLLSGFYGRLLAASVIVDVTLSVVAAVLQRLFLQKHPELIEQNKTSRSHAVMAIIGMVLLAIFGLPIIWLIIALMRFS